MHRRLNRAIMNYCSKGLTISLNHFKHLIPRVVPPRDECPLQAEWEGMSQQTKVAALCSVH